MTHRIRTAETAYQRRVLSAWSRIINATAASQVGTDMERTVVLDRRPR